MDRRLRTYQFKSLANPRKSASTWLKKHPMDCLIWATGKAKEARHRAPDDDDEEEGTETETDEERSFYEDGILWQSEKEALQALSLDEEMDENTEQVAVEGQRSPDATEVSDSQSDPGQAGDVMLSLEERLRGLQPETLRHRQVMHMIQVERTKRSRAHERNKILLRNRSVSTQNAELVSSDPEEPIPKNRSPVQSQGTLSTIDRQRRQPKNRHVEKLLAKHSRALGCGPRKRSSRSAATDSKRATTLPFATT